MDRSGVFIFLFRDPGGCWKGAEFQSLSSHCYGGAEASIWGGAHPAGVM